MFLMLTAAVFTTVEARMTKETQARVALFEGSMMTDDKAFQTNRNFGHKLSLQNLQSISVPSADTSFLLSFDQDGDRAAKYCRGGPGTHQGLSHRAFSTAYAVDRT